MDSFKHYFVPINNLWLTVFFMTCWPYFSSTVSSTQSQFFLYSSAHTYKQVFHHCPIYYVYTRSWVQLRLLEFDEAGGVIFPVLPCLMETSAKQLLLRSLCNYFIHESPVFSASFCNWHQLLGDVKPQFVIINRIFLNIYLLIY